MSLTLSASSFHVTIVKIIGWIGVFLFPIKATMFAVGALIIVDLFTGVWAAIKRDENITSNGFRRTVSKVIAYQLAIITSFIIDKYFAVGFGIEVVKIVAGLVAMTEFKSIMENISSITKLDLWKQILKQTQGQKIIPTKKVPKEPKDKQKKNQD